MESPWKRRVHSKKNWPSPGSLGRATASSTTLLVLCTMLAWHYTKEANMLRRCASRKRVVLWQQNKYPEALSKSNECLDLAVQEMGKQNMFVAAIHHEIGNVSLLSQQNPSEALSHLEKSSAIVRDLMGPEHSLIFELQNKNALAKRQICASACVSVVPASQQWQDGSHSSRADTTSGHTNTRATVQAKPSNERAEEDTSSESSLLKKEGNALLKAGSTAAAEDQDSQALALHGPGPTDTPVLLNRALARLQLAEREDVAELQRQSAQTSRRTTGWQRRCWVWGGLRTRGRWRVQPRLKTCTQATLVWWSWSSKCALGCTPSARQQFEFRPISHVKVKKFQKVKVCRVFSLVC